MVKARRWSAKGMTGTDIPRRLGVSGATVSRALAGSAVAVELVVEQNDDDNDDDDDNENASGDATESAPAPRVGEAEVRCRYAGAMLLHPFLGLVGAGDVFARLDSGPARR